MKLKRLCDIYYYQELKKKNIPIKDIKKIINEYNNYKNFNQIKLIPLNIEQLFINKTLKITNHNSNIKKSEQEKLKKWIN
jgi:hypothetical protein